MSNWSQVWVFYKRACDDRVGDPSPGFYCRQRSQEQAGVKLPANRVKQGETVEQSIKQANVQVWQKTIKTRQTVQGHKTQARQGKAKQSKGKHKDIGWLTTKQTILSM